MDSGQFRAGFGLGETIYKCMTLTAYYTKEQAESRNIREHKRYSVLLLIGFFANEKYLLKVL